jgi:tetratricopeptide (TPR) repeat protein
VFRFLARFASSKKPPASPRDRALHAIDCRDFARADLELGVLLQAAVGADDRAFLLNKRGVARMGLRQPERAREDFEAALDAVARFAPALTNLGNLALEAGDVGGAIARYEAAIDADPDYALAYLNLGAAYKKEGRFDRSVWAIRRAQRLEGRKVAARYTR